MSRLRSALLGIAVACILVSLAGCSAVQSTQPVLVPEWSLHVQGQTSIIASDATSVYLNEKRAFGNEVVAVSVKDGSFEWNQIPAPSATLSVLGNVMLMTQTLQAQYVVSAYSLTTGKQVWQKSFISEPYVLSSLGRFFVEADGRFRLEGLAGDPTAKTWAPPSGCFVKDVASDVGDSNFRVVTSCDGPQGSTLTVLNSELRAIRIDSYPDLDLESAQPAGPYLLLQDSDTQEVGVIYFGGSRIARGLGLSSATISSVGDAVEVVPQSGAPFFLDQKGRRVIPQGLPFLITQDFAGFSFTRQDLIDPTTGKVLNSSIGKLGLPKLLADGTGEVQTATDLSSPLSTIVTLFRYGTQRARISPSLHADTTKTIDGPTGVVQFTEVKSDLKKGEGGTVSLRYFGAQLAGPTGQVDVIQLPDAHSAALEFASISKADTSKDTKYASYGRCVARITSRGNSSTGTIEAVSASLFSVGVVDGGCNG